MKRLAGIFILIISIQATSAQDFNGIYRGDLFSKDNVITLRVKKGAATGVLYTSVNDKYTFQPVITGRELTGTLDQSSVIWTMKGTLTGDSLSLMMSSGQAIKQAILLRISSDPRQNVPDIIESFSRDEQLIGRWLLVKIENLDGSVKEIDLRYSGMIRSFESNGAYFAELPYLARQFKTSQPYPQVESKWSTQGSTLSITAVGKTHTSNYEIRNDTLITITIEKSFYLRRK